MQQLTTGKCRGPTVAEMAIVGVEDVSAMIAWIVLGL